MTITIDEAIEILHEDLGAATYDAHPGLYQAQKFGIEALTLIRLLRAAPGNLSIPLLSGETEK